MSLCLKSTTCIQKEQAVFYRIQIVQEQLGQRDKSLQSRASEDHPRCFQGNQWQHIHVNRYSNWVEWETMDSSYDKRKAVILNLTHDVLSMPSSNIHPQ